MNSSQGTKTALAFNFSDSMKEHPTPIELLRFLIVLSVLLNGSVSHSEEKPTDQESISADDIRQKVRLIHMKGGSIRISLPSAWERKGEGKLGDLSAMFSRSAPKGLLAIDMYSLNIPLFVCSSKSYQMQYLERIKNGLIEGEIKLEERSSLFGVPMLTVTRETKEGRKFRDIHFLRDCKYFIISFGFEKEYFDTQWVEIQKALTAMEFQ